MVGRLVCALLAMLPLIARAADASPVGISRVATSQLEVYYYDSLDYLVPYSVRTFTNALDWQRRMFGWTPSESTILLLQDRSDYGSATTYAAPRNTLVFDVAPLSHAF